MTRSKLNAVLAIINKRSSQIKSVITSVVAEALEFINITPTGNNQHKLARKYSGTKRKIFKLKRKSS